MKPLSSALLTSLAASILSTGCIIVHVEGDPDEEGWMFDLGGEEIAPDDFEHGDADFLLIAGLMGINGRFKLDFTCSPEELPDYLDRVSTAIEAKVVEDRDGTILSRRVPDRSSRILEYDGKDGRGEVEIWAGTADEDSGHSYQLRIAWSEG